VPAAGPARKATMTQQAVTRLVPEHRPGPVPVTIGPRPSPASPPSPAAPPARACDPNPLAGLGPEASKDYHLVLNAARTPRKG
jgi:hypothetical protein